jgi:hypothetical protein
LVACVLSHHPVSMNCKLLQPVVAMPQDARATVTIPAGAAVEVRTKLRKGGITEVLWEGECFSAQLDDLLGACAIDDVRRFGWY